MNGNNRILLCTGEEKFFDKNQTMFETKYSNIEKEYMYKSDTKLNKIFRNLGYPFIKMAVKSIWKKKLNEYEAIILFDVVVKNSTIKMIRKNNPNIRIIIYFRNQFSRINKKNLSLNKMKKYNCELWTYNSSDCQEYNFKYNNQFWNKSYIRKIKKNKIEFDCIFLGKVKDRLNLIEDIKKVFDNEKISSYFYLVQKSNLPYDMNKNDEYMDYLDYLDLICKSKCVLDIVGKDNNGLTLRPLETLFLEKKLITNYENIENYDFYNKENIFILGKDNIKNLKKFLDKPYKKIDKKIVEKYDFNTWINNFFERN